MSLRSGIISLLPEKEKEETAVKIAFLVLAIVWTVAACFIWGIGYWVINRDVDTVMARAQVAADAGDMLGYMVKLRDNMQSRGMTHGHTAFIFKTDMNDVGKQFEAVKKIIERLEKIKDLDTSSTTYQVALDDIRGILRELPAMAGAWFYIKTWWWLAIVTIVPWLITGLAWIYAALRSSY